MSTGQRYSSPVIRIIVVMAFVVLTAIAILSIIGLFHQKVVPSHVHDAHPQNSPSQSVLWVDSERMKLSAPYNYTSGPFAVPQTANYVEQWTCYPSPASNVSSYTLTIVVKDTTANTEQTSLIACNELDPQNGSATVPLTAKDYYTVFITSDGPWTLNIQHP